jgi:hypothetical protein
MVPTSEVDVDESAVNLKSDIGFVTSYVDSCYGGGYCCGDACNGGISRCHTNPL